MINSRTYPVEACFEKARIGLSYLICARQAENEGYPQIASLFRETAVGDSAYAPLQLRALRRLLADAASLGEAHLEADFQVQEILPAMMAAGNNEGDNESPQDRGPAQDRKKAINNHYQAALKNLAESAKGDYYVCCGCGFTWKGQRLEQCPRCQVETINFVKVG